MCAHFCMLRHYGAHLRYPILRWLMQYTSARARMERMHAIEIRNSKEILHIRCSRYALLDNHTRLAFLFSPFLLLTSFIITRSFFSREDEWTKKNLWLLLIRCTSAENKTGTRSKTAGIRQREGAKMKEIFKVEDETHKIKDSSFIFPNDMNYKCASLFSTLTLRRPLL